jgi:hypothetical protein
VLRSSTAGGPFTVVATIDTTTGAATVSEGVVNVWSPAHSYVPSDGPLTSPDPSSRFEYVEVGGPRTACFQLLAYNEVGDGDRSASVCATSK